MFVTWCEYLVFICVIQVRMKFQERRDDQLNGQDDDEPSTEQNGGDNQSVHGDNGEVKKELVTVVGRPEDVEAAKEAPLVSNPEQFDLIN